MLLDVQNLKTYFPLVGGLMRRTVGYVRAVDDISFHIGEGETLGLVGESGCGKSTAGRTLMHLIRPTAGQVVFQGEELTALSRRQLNQRRLRIQMVFQDPLASLNPRMTIDTIDTDALVNHGLLRKSDARKKAGELLDMVGLSRRQLRRYPHELSGGMRQRVSIARALSLNPRLMICDEPVSSLDVSVQAQILNLFKDLQKELGISYLFISHNLGVIRYISNRIAVMYLGRIVEMGDRREIFNHPRHPYTHALLKAIPHSDPTRRRRFEPLTGEVPSPATYYPGCPFFDRCAARTPPCTQQRPRLEPVSATHQVACFNPQ